VLFFGKRWFLILLFDSLKRKEKKGKYKNSFHRIKNIILSFLLILLIVSLLFVYLTNTLQIPIEGKDALRYGTLGKVMFMEKSLAYRWILPYPKSGSYTQMNHPPSFSLLLTWEKLMDNLISIEKDLYYKSLSAYYALLILVLFAFWLFKINKFLSLIGIFFILSGMNFFNKLTQHHIDSYRGFFLLISWIFLAYAIKNKDFLSFFLLGVYSGFAAFAHSIGAILVIVNYLALLIFMRESIEFKLKKTYFVPLLIIAFGWIHYILDIFWGYGWIFFNRKVTWWG